MTKVNPFSILLIMSIDLNLWKNHFKEKFDLDGLLNAMIWCGNCFVTSGAGEIEPNREDMEQLVKAMNHEEYSHAVFKEPSYKDGTIFYKDKNNNQISFYIRGWGYLTSQGINEVTAACIQDSLAEYIINCMRSVNV